MAVIIPDLLRRINVVEKDGGAYEEIARRNERKVAKLKEKVKEFEKNLLQSIGQQVAIEIAFFNTMLTFGAKQVETLLVFSK